MTSVKSGLLGAASRHVGISVSETFEHELWAMDENKQFFEVQEVCGGSWCVCARACMRVHMNRKKEVNLVKFLPIRSLCLHFGLPHWAYSALTIKFNKILLQMT